MWGANQLEPSKSYFSCSWELSKFVELNWNYAFWKKHNLHWNSKNMWFEEVVTQWITLSNLDNLQFDDFFYFLDVSTIFLDSVQRYSGFTEFSTGSLLKNLQRCLTEVCYLNLSLDSQVPSEISLSGIPRWLFNNFSRTFWKISVEVLPGIPFEEFSEISLGIGVPSIVLRISFRGLQSFSWDFTNISSRNYFTIFQDFFPSFYWDFSNRIPEFLPRLHQLSFQNFSSNFLLGIS